MQNIDLNTKELSKKYGLNEWIVKEETEKIISKILTETYNYEVIAQFNGTPDVFEIYGYPEKEGQLNEIKLIPSKMRYSVIKRIITELTYSLKTRVIYQDCENLKSIIKKAMNGTIELIENGNLFVHIHGLSDSFEEIIAVCKRESQTPKERREYNKNSVLSFHVSPSVISVYDGSAPRIQIRLSRTSKKLTEGLIENELVNRCLDVEVKCTKRIAGAYSEVMVSHRIPKDVIKHVSDQLKERIIVKW